MKRLCVMVGAAMACSAGSLLAQTAVRLERDGTKITRDTKVAPGTWRLPDAGDDGAVLIAGDGITVDFGGAELVGCTDEQPPDTYTGKGIVLRGRNVTLRNAKVRGYKVGIYATECPGLTIEDVDVSGNYRKRLLSTPEAEDGSDWLFPHNNDDHEWMKNYGAGLYVERADGVTIRRVRARHGQNGIIIDRVNDSKIYDNDCSFLSGWGLAMWRSNGNTITRNAFDFCIRGYSHGVYNRGQDSAGILMFEQNSRNLIAENSVTHGGDGLFGFAGQEALGEKPAPAGFDHTRKGCNDNLLIGNDFSYAAAHGIELTFSFGNRFLRNRLVGNAICGVWGGYSQDTLIAENEIAGNGEMGYGLERGGVNIEHGSNNVIRKNRFSKNRCGVHLWWDEDPGFVDKPWGKVNHPGSTKNVIAENTFDGDNLAIHLRETTETAIVDNRFAGVGEEIVADEKSRASITDKAELAPLTEPRYEAIGQTRPVGARKALWGRQNIIMTEWGPYDFESPLVYPQKVAGGPEAVVRVLGTGGSFRVSELKGNVRVSEWKGEVPGKLLVRAVERGVHPFTLGIEVGSQKLRAAGVLVWLDWQVAFYRWKDDPRENAEAWKKLIAGEPADRVRTTAIDFKWGGGAPSAKTGPDHFGTVATTTMRIPAGAYRIVTVSDDGIRVWIDNRLLIDDWTWHPPKENAADVKLEAGEHHVRIEHFEIDGLAQLQFRIEPQ